MNLTPEQINQRIAEKCGISKIETKDGKFVAFSIPDGDTDHWSKDPPNYSSDLNACHEMEKVIDEKGMILEYSHALAEVVTPDINNKYRSTLGWQTTWPMLHATAPQRCEAFLKVFNLWTD